MAYEIKFEGPNADADSLEEMKSFVGDKGFDSIVTAARALDGDEEVDFNFQTLNMMCGFAGVTGFPIHALGRKYCPKAYRQWLIDYTELNDDAEGL